MSASIRPAEMRSMKEGAARAERRRIRDELERLGRKQGGVYVLLADVLRVVEDPK